MVESKITPHSRDILCLWFDGLYSIYCLVDTDLSWVTFQAYKLFFCLFYKASKTIFLLVSTSFWQPLFHFFVFWPTLVGDFSSWKLFFLAVFLFSFYGLASAAAGHCTGLWGAQVFHQFTLSEWAFSLFFLSFNQNELFLFFPSFNQNEHFLFYSSSNQNELVVFFFLAQSKWTFSLCFSSNQNETFHFSPFSIRMSFSFLASQDALEVMSVTDSLSDWVIVCIDLTDVTLVSKDTFRRLKYWWEPW